MTHTCERHPDREGLLSIDLPSIGIKTYWCKECRDDYDARYPSKGFGRAFASGTSKEAHREAQESKRYQDEYERSKPNAKVRKYL